VARISVSRVSMTGPEESVAADQGGGHRGAFLGRPRGWGWAVPVAAAAAGLLLVSSAVTARGSDLRAERRTGLAGLVQERQDTVEDLTAQVAVLQTDVEALAAAAGSDRRLDTARAEIDRLSAAAGMTPVSGPAVTVTLDDAPRDPDGELREGVTPDDLVVHQQDVQAVVNALWAGGADAMQIMDQRVISTSAVRCVGNTLVLQGRVYSPPFTVTAVGDVTRLREALDASPGVTSYRQWVDVVGLGYRVDASEEITLPAYAGALRLPVTEQSDTEQSNAEQSPSEGASR
jgi:uncharacterized protein YlxW (UPF0749 family)